MARGCHYNHVQTPGVPPERTRECVGVKTFSPEAVEVNIQRRRLLRFAVLGMAATLLPACRNSEPENKTYAVGDRFPDVTLAGLDGRMVPFGSYGDAALVVNFWATWCEPCRREMPSLEKLGTLFSPKELLVVGVSVDGDRDKAREFAQQYKIAMPLLSDSEQALSNDLLKIPAFPITYLLKRDRTIAHIFVGARDWAEPTVVEEIEKLLTVRRIKAA